jgi:Spy/CpxP family protein refolding chaperone
MKLQKVVMVVFFLLLVGTAFAEARNSSQNRMDNRLDKMKTELALTNEQVDRIRKINADYRAKLEVQERQMRPLRNELKTLMEEEIIDMNRIRAKLREISNVEIERKILSIERRLETQKVLTPTQRKQWAENEQERKRENQKGTKQQHRRERSK